MPPKKGKKRSAAAAAAGDDGAEAAQQLPELTDKQRKRLCTDARAPDPGCLVWAKFGHYPPWPAMVLPRFDDSGDFDMPWSERPADTHLCRFFGSYDVSWIAADRLSTWEDGLKHRTTSKPKQTAALKKAVKEAEKFLMDGEVPPQFQSTIDAMKDDVHDQLAALDPQVAARKLRQLQIMRDLGLAKPDPYLFKG